MKKIINAFWNVLTSVGEARYAAHLARTGRVEEAKKIYV